MKKIYYIANVKIPTTRAHGIQIMEMCQAFALLGREVELLIPTRRLKVKEDPFEFYDIKPIFSIRKLWSLDIQRWGKFGYLLGLLSFAKMAAFFSLGKDDIFYTRDELVAVALSLMGKRVAWEAHMGHRNFVVKLLVLFGLKIVVISQGLKDLYVSMGVGKSDIMVAPDGADIERFDIDISQDEARKKLGLPNQCKIVLYKGSFGKWKGVETLAESARYVNTPEVKIVFIGGLPDEEERIRTEFPHDSLLLMGNRPRQETPIFQKAADLLVIPNSAKEDISKLYTSPMKMFGYMASGVPIVASDLPSLREILGHTDAYFFKPDDAKSLAESIDRALGEQEESKQRAERALNKVRGYSWKSRAEKIVKFVENV
ncbi:glycosyltransferase [Candidatus Parcubacteria bacterium]|nr:glycosyltransferase [Candidatus Parcubacteria bacterium]